MSMYYKVFVFLPEQSGETAPEGNIVINTLDGVPTISRDSAGVYRFFLQDGFGDYTPAISGYIDPEAGGAIYYGKTEDSSNFILKTLTAPGGEPADDLLVAGTDVPIEIRVYNW